LKHYTTTKPIYEKIFVLWLKNFLKVNVSFYKFLGKCAYRSSTLNFLNAKACAERYGENFFVRHV
jgi:hypothetical protein